MTTSDIDAMTAYLSDYAEGDWHASFTCGIYTVWITVAPGRKVVGYGNTWLRAACAAIEQKRSVEITIPAIGSAPG